jgi:hypothetical protein
MGWYLWRARLQMNLDPELWPEALQEDDRLRLLGVLLAKAGPFDSPTEGETTSHSVLGVLLFEPVPQREECREIRRFREASE